MELTPNSPNEADEQTIYMRNRFQISSLWDVDNVAQEQHLILGDILMASQVVGRVLYELLQADAESIFAFN